MNRKIIVPKENAENALKFFSYLEEAKEKLIKKIEKYELDTKRQEENIKKRYK